MAERLTRNEFIDGYLSRSNLSRYRTTDGYQINKYRRFALPCSCGEEGCEGWAMIPESTVKWHAFKEAKEVLGLEFEDLGHDQFTITDDERAALNRWAEAYVPSAGRAALEKEQSNA